MRDRTHEAYHKDLEACVPMTAEEEYKTAVKMRTAKSSKVRAAARKKFIHRNLRLVVKIATSMRHVHLPIEDRVAAGNVGLVIAVDRFEPERGFRFTTYGSWWIRAEIDRAGSNLSRLVRLPVRRGKDTFQLFVSMDAPLSVDGTVRELTLHDVLPSEGVSVEETLSAEGEDRNVRRYLHVLTARQRRIIELRFGFDGGEGRTLEEIGGVLGLTRERIRQIQEDAQERLRKAMLP